MKSIRSLPSRPPRQNYVSKLQTRHYIQEESTRLESPAQKMLHEKLNKVESPAQKMLREKLNNVELRINYTLVGQLTFATIAVVPRFSVDAHTYISQYIDTELYTTGNTVLSMLFMGGTLMYATRSAILSY